MDLAACGRAILFGALLPVVCAIVTELVRERRGGLDPEAGATGQVATGSLFAVIGGIAGCASALAFPHALVPRMEGAGLILSPLAAGIAMHFLGLWRREQGSYPSLLATFWGGALFGLAAAIVRFLVIRYR
ncbi:MAG TPA: hypothetical protein VMI94_28300 [Bryobacteraceae bacterium]|nr:hypothetical protein [Bryobacteraceae bacterium]